MTATSTPVKVCQGVRADGERCASPGVGADGWCNLHRPGADPVALGRAGGLKSAEKRQEQAKSVRDRLRDKVEAEYETLAAAFDVGLASDDERTRVATAQALLAEAYGRPAQAIVGDPERPVQFILDSVLARAREES